MIPKDEGIGIMISSFQSRGFGSGFAWDDLSDSDLKRINYFRADKAYMDKYATKIFNLTLSANHPVHPCAPSKGRAHACTKNCARIHRESPEDAHARAQQRTHL